MSCCSTPRCAAPGPTPKELEFMNNCPNDCCNLFKLMMDPCAQMLDRNVKRNVYGQVNCHDRCAPMCPPPCPLPAKRCLVRYQAMMPIPCRCPPVSCETIDTSATPPIPQSIKLTKPRNNHSWKLLCCSRPKWAEVTPPKLPWIPQYDFPILPPLSSRYGKWIKRQASRTDSNLSASRFSSLKQNRALIKAIPIPCGVGPCPCHCCS